MSFLFCFCWNQKKRATKNDAYTSNFQPVNSDLRPFREKKDNVPHFKGGLTLSNLSVENVVPTTVMYHLLGSFYQMYVKCL